MSEIHAAIACNLDANILSAAYPLFETSAVDGIEWSFDALHNRKEIPGWFSTLLHAYAAQGRLIGHGIFFSLFSGRWQPEQQRWLDHLRKVSAQYKFAHITEHFGFMTGEDFHHGAPLSIPYTNTTLRIGRDRLMRIYDACHCPVGLENLAFSYSPDEVKRHGEFLEKLIEPINGFIILDLHNLYCQAHNFSISHDELLNMHPLHRVREIHISGGSWADAAAAPGGRVRRDTHDDAVPAEVFELLQKTIPLCPNLKFVVMEQLSVGLFTDSERTQFGGDFMRMREIVKTRGKKHPEPTNNFLPEDVTLSAAVAEDETLAIQQSELSEILETAGDYNEAHTRLQASALAHTAWDIERWTPYMLETAMHIAQKWKKN